MLISTFPTFQALRRERFGERFDLLEPLAQRRQHNGDAVQPVEEIHPERTPLDLALEIAVGRRHEANIHIAILQPTDATDLPFLQHAEHRPDSPAVIAPDRTLSYREVRDRALGLAKRLQRWGVRPGGLVAVVMEVGWNKP